MAKLRTVGPDFVAEAPVAWAFTERLRAPRSRVFAAVSGDAKTWTTWFPGVSDGGQDGTPRLGVRRWVRVGPTTYRETVIVWDEPAAWAFRVDETNAPLASALVERWTFAEDGDATVATWTFAAEPRVLMRILGPVMRRYMARLFKRAIRNLERELSG